jgi:hypothetical protein
MALPVPRPSFGSGSLVKDTEHSLTPVMAIPSKRQEDEDLEYGGTPFDKRQDDEDLEYGGTPFDKRQDDDDLESASPFDDITGKS